MKGMSQIVKVIAELVKDFIILFGIYIILNGHLSPGGGFAGGVIIAASYILVTLAFGRERAMKELSERGSHLLDNFGVILFWTVAVLGWLIPGQAFFSNFIQRFAPGSPYNILTSGIILVCNIAIGIKVGASLFSVFTALAHFEPPLKGDDEE